MTLPLGTRALEGTVQSPPAIPAGAASKAVSTVKKRSRETWGLGVKFGAGIDRVDVGVPEVWPFTGFIKKLTTKRLRRKRKHECLKTRMFDIA